jgi:hypothetical protein
LRERYRTDHRRPRNDDGGLRRGHGERLLHGHQRDELVDDRIVHRHDRHDGRDVDRRDDDVGHDGSGR